MSGLSVRLAQRGPIPLDLAFTVAPGELVALFGPSGSGKSTILRAIAGLYRARKGRISVNGDVWLDSTDGLCLPAWQRRVGLLFQSYALFPHLSAAGNVMAALGHLARAERRTRAQELLAQVHLADLAGRRPAQLSGGEQQRVALARALAREPQVLLLDEPFSAVDRMTRESLYRELVHLRRRLGVPTLLVTHDLEEARLLADRICLLDRGRVLEDGPPAEVVARPRSAAAARAVGHRNILSGRLGQGRDGTPVIFWNDRQVALAQAPALPHGAPVDWCIAPESVLLADDAADAAGTVAERLRLGDAILLSILLDGEAAPLTVRAPATEAARLPDAGERVACRFPAAAIHVMLRQDAEDADAVADGDAGKADKAQVGSPRGHCGP
ncbi:MAG: ABC transporter ATP-binding protein [Rhodothalassiaceae bacterium]